MPTAMTYFSDESHWLVTQCEVIIPISQATHLSAEEIGQRVIALMTRIQPLAAYVNEWDKAPKDASHHKVDWLRSLEEIENHVAKIKEQEHIRQAARIRAPHIRRSLQGSYESVFIALGRRDGFDCRTCGVSSELQIDHIVAVINGGTNDLDNLQLLCRACNGKKSDKG